MCFFFLLFHTAQCSRNINSGSSEYTPKYDNYLNSTLTTIQPFIYLSTVDLTWPCDLWLGQMVWTQTPEEVVECDLSELSLSLTQCLPTVTPLLVTVTDLVVRATEVFTVLFISKWYQFWNQHRGLFSVFVNSPCWFVSVCLKWKVSKLWNRSLNQTPSFLFHAPCNLTEV